MDPKPSIHEVISYHFTDYWIRFGLVQAYTSIQSELYLGRYQISIDQMLINSSVILQTGTHYYVHMVQESPLMTTEAAPAESDRFIQYFRIYSSTFIGTDNSMFQICKDYAPLTYPYYQTNKNIALLTLVGDAWQNKTICVEKTTTRKICYPETFKDQFYFQFDNDSNWNELSSACSIEDISECLSCSAEKLCTECQFGKLLVGGSLEYSGRCVCPTGYYKFGFDTTVCNKTEYVKEAWAKYQKEIELMTEIDAIFPNYAFTIREINEDTAYIDYLTKFHSLTKTYVNDTQFTQLFEILEMLGTRNNKNVAEIVVKIFDDLIDKLIAAKSSLNNNMMLTLINKLMQFGSNTISLSNFESQKQTYFNLLFSKALGVLIKYSPASSATFSDIATVKWYYNFDITSLTTVGTGLKLQLQQSIIDKLGVCGNYYLAFNQMNLFNPYDYVQNINKLSEIVQIQLFCDGDVKTTPTNIELESNEYFIFQQQPFEISSNLTAICSYWDGSEKGWSQENAFEGELTNYCYQNQFGLLAIIAEGSSQFICGSRCKSCDGTGCLICYSSYYLLNSKCYGRYELTLDMVLQRFTNIYILSYSSSQCIAANKTDIMLKDCNSSDIPYLSLQWNVNYDLIQHNATTIKKIYTFTNVEYTEIKIKSGEIFEFEIQSLQDFETYSELFKNEGRLFPYSSSIITQQCIVNDFSAEECNNGTIPQTQLWEFLPKKGYLLDPIEVDLDITEQTDVLTIEYQANNKDAIYAIAGAYNSDLSYDYTCSSANTNSIVQFIRRENDVYVSASLANLNNCGFSISNGDNGLYILSGYIIHIFPDTNQLYYYQVAVTFISSLSIEDTNVALNSDSSDLSIVIIQQQTESFELTTHYIPQVSLYGSESDSEILDVIGQDQLKIQIDLPSTVKSLYDLTIPNNLAKLYNAFSEYTCAATLSEQISGKNSYIIDINLADVKEGSYRLKFTCTLSLNTTARLRRLLTTDTVDLMIDKQLIIQASESNSSSSNNNSNQAEAKAANITDIQPDVLIEDSENDSQSLLMIIIIGISVVAILGLIFAALYFTRRNLKNIKQREFETNSENDRESIQDDDPELKEVNVEKDNEDEIPQEFEAESNEVQEDEFVIDEAVNQEA
eukprot:TRINITY_DN727_c0_g1_i7.p1 TRINITY_DN727_c0_g1~~TRINITY_DN727_c0_g1_i7.p1  ORF type:complete len:1129 (-),score=174.34 TRINITY_DN727_c0_g1_i7:115-3501(-)